MLRKYSTILATVFSMSFSVGTANLITSTLNQVFVTEDGIYVASEGIFHAVESIAISECGSIIATPRIRTDICPICGCDGYVSGRFCPNCGFPDDSLRQ